MQGRVGEIMRFPTKKTSFQFRCQIYKLDIVFFMNMSREEMWKKANRYHKKLGGFLKEQDGSLKSTTTAASYNTPYGHVIWFKQFHKNEPARNWENISHEIFHMAADILTRCGMSLSDETHEAYAYLIGFITYEFVKKIGDIK